MIRITTTQNKYLLKLKKGPKTTKELAEMIGSTEGATAKTIARLRKVGLVQSTNEKAPKHRLVKSEEPEVVKGRNPHKITEEEIQYAAELKNAGLTGRELKEKYNERYPNRETIHHIIQKARARKLCR